MRAALAPPAAQPLSGFRTGSLHPLPSPALGQGPCPGLAPTRCHRAPPHPGDRREPNPTFSFTPSPKIRAPGNGAMGVPHGHSPREGPASPAHFIKPSCLSSHVTGLLVGTNLRVFFLRHSKSGQREEQADGRTRAQAVCVSRARLLPGAPRFPRPSRAPAGQRRHVHVVNAAERLLENPSLGLSWRFLGGETASHPWQYVSAELRTSPSCEPASCPLLAGTATRAWLPVLLKPGIRPSSTDVPGRPHAVPPPALGTSQPPFTPTHLY